MNVKLPMVCWKCPIFCYIFLVFHVEPLTIIKAYKAKVSGFYDQKAYMQKWIDRSLFNSALKFYSIT